MKELFDTDGTIFMGAQRNPNNCRVGLFGVPYDGTTSFRPGTRFGPAAIREVSQGLESYCPQLDRDLDDIAFADLGAVEIPFGAPQPVVDAVLNATQASLALGLKPLMLGGEHSISSGAVAAVAAKHPDLVLVQYRFAAFGPPFSLSLSPLQLSASVKPPAAHTSTCPSVFTSSVPASLPHAS